MEKRAKNGSEGRGRAGFRVHGQDGCHLKPTLEGVRLALQVFGEAGSRQRAKLTRRL